MKKTVLELGGNNPMVILGDADIDDAVQNAVFGSNYHSGQICTALNRIIVDQTIFDEFAVKFVEASKQVKSSNSKDPENLNGPLISSKEVNRILTAIETPNNEGAEILLEGKREGNVIIPNIVKGTNNSYTARNEMFGPVVILSSAKDEADAIAIANDTAEGLSSSVFSQNIKRTVNVATQIEAGYDTY